MIGDFKAIKFPLCTQDPKLELQGILVFYVNFISVNLINAIFQNFPKIFGIYVFKATNFINMIFWAKIAKKSY